MDLAAAGFDLRDPLARRLRNLRRYSHSAAPRVGVSVIDIDADQRQWALQPDAPHGRRKNR
eukprot:8090344-Alexandrium_andersonii.AAC.1